ncbi:hypothetical protein ACFQ4L_06920 [Lapidilactobacillus mulanensis]|uniref:Transposase n=1 Tax=Lapidilactobacillus mulanensis TaxID=2485999 RepID=A0ABW4DS39_9LACO
MIKNPSLPTAEVAPENWAIAVADSFQPIENQIVFKHDLSLFRNPRKSLKYAACYKFAKPAH